MAAATSAAGLSAAQQEMRRGHLSATDEELCAELACAHWATNHFGMDDLNWNHISARSNGGGGILITPGDRLWDMIEPAHIVKVRMLPCPPVQCGLTLSPPVGFGECDCKYHPRGGVRRQPRDQLCGAPAHRRCGGRQLPRRRLFVPRPERAWLPSVHTDTRLCGLSLTSGCDKWGPDKACAAGVPT